MGRMIGPKTWDRIVEFFLDFLDSREPQETYVGCYVGIYALNSVLVSRRPEMGMEFGSKKWNRGWTSGLPMDSPLLGFGTIKISHGLCELDKKSSMCCVLELLK